MYILLGLSYTCKHGAFWLTAMRKLPHLPSRASRVGDRYSPNPKVVPTIINNLEFRSECSGASRAFGVYTLGHSIFKMHSALG